MPDRLAPQWASSALTRVPSAWPGAGWTTSAGRLDQDDQMLVLEQDLERAAPRRCGRRAAAAGTSSTNRSPGLTRRPGLGYHRSPWRRCPSRTSGLQARARQLRQPAGQEQVQPLARRPPLPAASSIGPLPGPPLAAMVGFPAQGCSRLFVVVGGVGYRRRHCYADLRGHGQARRAHGGRAGGGPRACPARSGAQGGEIAQVA